MGSVITAIINQILKLVTGGFTSSIGSSQVWLFTHLDELILHGSRSPLSAPWFYQFFQKMELLSLALVLPVVLIGVISALVSGSSAHLWRLVTVYLPISLVGSGVILFLLEAFNATIDAMSSWLVDSQGSSLASFANLLSVLSPHGGIPSAVPFLLVLVVGIVSVLASLSLYLELLLRQGVILVLGAFVPFALLFVLLSSSRAVLFRYLEVVIGVVFSKLVVVVLLCLGVQMMQSSGSGGGFSIVISGMAIMVLSAFSPYLVFSLIPINHLDHQARTSRAVRSTAITAASNISLPGSSSLGSQSNDIPFANATTVPSYLKPASTSSSTGND